MALGQGALGPRALGPPRATRAPWAPWAPMGAHGGPMGPHGAPWGPLGPLGPKSKLGFDQGALPSANTSPEIRLWGFPSSVSSHAALPSGFGLKWAKPFAAETGQLGVSLPAM